jgi:hypothetical protein
VAINVVVTDKQGRTLTDLTEGAFQVSEDHRPQRITTFTKDPLPLSIAIALDTSASMRGDRYAVGISDPRGRGEPLDEETLKALVDPTDGFVTTVHANADITSTVERVLNDLRDQYLIGFVPTHPADGNFHKLQVTVRGCDCHARARAGFVHSR